VLRTDQELVEAIGRRIAEVRRKNGWTQEVAAEKLGISTRHMTRLERGVNVTVCTLARIARILGVTPAALLTQPRSLAPRPRGRPRKAV
jgi:transcriptional regulator with XRE-family HTH domain